MSFTRTSIQVLAVSGGMGARKHFLTSRVRVFNPFAPSQLTRTVPSQRASAVSASCHEREKRARYEERVREVESRIHSACVLGGRRSQQAHDHLLEAVGLTTSRATERLSEPYSVAISRWPGCGPDYLSASCAPPSPASEARGGSLRWLRHFDF